MMRRLRALAVAALLTVTAVVPAVAQFIQNTITSVGGSGTAYTGTLANATSLAAIANVPLVFVPNTGGTGAATLTLTGTSTFAATPIRKNTGSGLSPLANGDLVAGQPYVIAFDATNTTFDILSGIPSGAGIGLPQGYLTPCQLTSGTPATGCTAGILQPTGDVSAATTLYYEPAFGATVPIYNGSAFINFQFSELTLTVPSSRLANTIYDVLIFSNSGVVTPCISVAWTTSTAGSGNRGSGAGTAQIAQVNGIWTNAVAVTGCVNGASSFNISANQGTVVATCLVDGTNGQLTFNAAVGQSRKWACVNIYNKQNITLQLQDPTASWAYSTGSWRESRGQTTNFVTALQSVAMEDVDVEFFQAMDFTCSSSATAGASLGIGINSTSTPSGQVGEASCFTSGTSTTVLTFATPVAHAILGRGIGSNAINSLEFAQGANGATLLGTGTGTGSGTMLLTARWRG